MASFTNNASRNTAFFTQMVDPEMIQVQRTNAFNFIMKTLYTLHVKHANNVEAQKPYVFGGYVRDKLLGVEPVDMDIYASRKVIKDFLEFLRASERLVAYRRNITDITSNEMDYFCFKIQVEVPGQDRIVSIDLVTDQQIWRHTPTPFRSTKHCDFTCNNLVMYYDGSISSRVKIANMTREDTTTMCIRDVMTKRLNNMYTLPELPGGTETPSPSDYNHQMYSYQKYRTRIQKMQSKGFVIYEDLSVHCAPFPEMQFPDNASTLLEEGQDPSQLTCAICRGDYDQETIRQTIVCTCNHHYHIDCIRRWCQSDQSNASSCPTCRALVSYRFSSRTA